MFPMKQPLPFETKFQVIDGPHVWVFYFTVRETVQNRAYSTYLWPCYLTKVLARANFCWGMGTCYWAYTPPYSTAGYFIRLYSVQLLNRTWQLIPLPSTIDWLLTNAHYNALFSTMMSYHFYKSRTSLKRYDSWLPVLWKVLPIEVYLGETDLAQARWLAQDQKNCLKIWWLSIFLEMTWIVFLK